MNKDILTYSVLIRWKEVILDFYVTFGKFQFVFFFFFSLENNNQLLISWHNENGHTGELSLEWLKQNSYSVMAQEHRNQQMVTQPYVGKVNGMIGQFGGLIVTLKITSLLLKSPEHYKSFTAGFQIVF